MLRAILRNAGIQPCQWLHSIRGWRRFAEDRAAFKKMSGADSIAWGSELPMLQEWYETSGGLGVYFHQDRCVARWIFDASPLRHLDVGSRVDGFIGHLSVFREVEVIDIRPAPGEVHGVKFHQLDLMAPMSTEWVGCTDSLSCLHTIEHFGLGRYGDPIDPDGHLKGLTQLKQMVKSGGRLYLSTQIGPERVEFNAHRVFAAKTVLDWFTDDWEIERVAIINDQETLIEDVDRNSEEVERHFGCQIGVMIVVARKED